MLRIFQSPLTENDFQVITKMLKDNKIGVIPFDTTYGLIGKAFEQNAYIRLNTVKGARKTPFAVAFPNLEFVLEYSPTLDPIRTNLLSRLHSAPVTCVISSIFNGVFGLSGTLAVRIPSTTFLDKFFKHFNFPVWATSANLSGEAIPFSSDDLSDNLLEKIDFVVNDGVTRYKQESTIIDLSQLPPSILRAGYGSEKFKNKLETLMNEFNILVVCTGNICRSPLGEVLVQHYANEYGLTQVKVSSAGTHATPGSSATIDTAIVAEQKGLTLANHQSRQLDLDLIEQSDLILVATLEHYNFINRVSPENIHKTKMLGEPIQLNKIPDPYMSGIEMYMEIGELIDRAAKGWIEILETHLKPPK